MPTTKFQGKVQAPDVSEEQAQVLHILDTRGLFGIMLIIMLEMATPIGILFPTDAIVFGAGLYFASKPIWGGVWVLMALFSLAVVLGDLLGYWWGTLLSPKLQTMQDNRIFKRKYLTMCQSYFDEYGNSTMIVSKFLPIRSIIPLVAGVIMKPFVPFLLQSIGSAILWIVSLVGMSYLIIYFIPTAANYIGLLTFLFVVIPQVASAWYMVRPMMKRYEARMGKATENLSQIANSFSAIKSEMSVIGGQFATMGGQFANIGHEMKEIVQKVVLTNDETPAPTEPVQTIVDPTVVISPVIIPPVVVPPQMPVEPQAVVGEQPGGVPTVLVPIEQSPVIQPSEASSLSGTTTEVLSGGTTSI